MHEKKWVTLFRPGFLGANRAEQFAKWTDMFGPNQWRLAWKVNSWDILNKSEPFFTDYLGACALYEDAYFHFLRDNPSILEELVSTASEVYDDRPSNIDAGLDYRGQETERTHIQDVAIRRSLVRLGVWFRGRKPIRIRQEKGFHRLSVVLSPGNVPFHLPEVIVQPELVGWWKPQSVEAAYQSGRFLQVTQTAWDMVRRSRKQDRHSVAKVAPTNQVRAFLVQSSYENLVYLLKNSLAHGKGPRLVFHNCTSVGKEVYLILCENASDNSHRIWCCYELRKPEQGFRKKNLFLVWSMKDKEQKAKREVVLPEIPGAIEDCRYNHISITDT